MTDSDSVDDGLETESATTDTAEPTSEPDGHDDEPTDLESPGPVPKRRHVVAYLVVPILVMCLAAVAGYLKYREGSLADEQAAASSSIQATTDGTIALLSYNPDTAQTTLTAARTRSRRRRAAPG